jgi:hypothetical protein
MKIEKGLLNFKFNNPFLSVFSEFLAIFGKCSTNYN